MGLSQKLMKSYVEGCNDTWNIFDHILSNTPGIGAKTRDKIRTAMTDFTIQKLEESTGLRESELKKLRAEVNQIGGTTNGNR